MTVTIERAGVGGKLPEKERAATKELTADKRSNIERFPQNFMFVLTALEKKAAKKEF